MRQSRVIADPRLVLLAGCLIAITVFGARSTFGLFIEPFSSDRGWGRDVFALAMAIQQLLWGLLQPISGAISDRFGTRLTLCVGALAYGGGIALMSTATTQFGLYLSGGLLVGVGLAGCGFPIVISAIGRMTPPERRSWALGIATAAGSLGQFLFVPIGQLFIQRYGWAPALALLAIPVLLIPLFAIPLRGSAAVASEPQTSLPLHQAVQRAFSHNSYWLLLCGFFVCGFHVSFITVHLPAYLHDVHVAPAVAAWALALIGLFNVFGSYTAGTLGQTISKRQLLAGLYIARGIAILLFLMFEKTTSSVLMFAAAMGFLWLSTVPLTSGLVATMFGTRYLGTLFGFVFMSHQLGAFIGIYLGGYLYETQGSYDFVWQLAIVLSFIAALLHWPIDERQAEGFVAAPVSD